MYCKKCGTLIDDLDFICPNCGTLLKNSKGQPLQSNKRPMPNGPQPNNGPMPNGPQSNNGPMPNKPQPNNGPMPNRPQPNIGPMPNGPQPPMPKPKKPREDTGSFGWFILGFFIPIVGLIMWAIWRKKFPKNAKKCIRGALVGWAVSLIIILSIVAYCSVLSNPAIKM